MIDKSNLSKLKYIYRIYSTDDKSKVHCEKYPIAYINERYVYFIVGDKTTLHSKMMGQVKEVYNSVKDIDIPYYGRDFDNYFFFVNDFDRDTLLQGFSEEYLTRKLEEVRSTVAYKRERFIEAVAELDDIEAQLNKVRNNG